MLKRIVRTVSEVTAREPSTTRAMVIPVIAVIIEPVCRGLNPRMDILFLPIFVPRISPRYAKRPLAIKSPIMKTQLRSEIR